MTRRTPQAGSLVTGADSVCHDRVVVRHISGGCANHSRRIQRTALSLKDEAAKKLCQPCFTGIRHVPG